jgi:hypothetical protein
MNGGGAGSAGSAGGGYTYIGTIESPNASDVDSILGIAGGGGGCGIGVHGGSAGLISGADGYGDCAGRGGTQKFGGAGAFARELELFLHDFEGLSVDDEEKKVDDEGSKDAPPVRSRLERVDRLRKRYGSSLEHSSGGMRAPLSVGLAKLLELFRDSAALDESDDTFFLCALDERVSLASLLDGISPRISFRNKYTICMAPVGRDDDELKDAFFRFASSMAVAKKVRLKAEIERVDWVLPRSPERVLQIEQAHKTFDLYLWLGQRFPEQYPDMPAARECAEKCSSLISDALMNMSDDSRRRVPRVDGQGRRRGRGKGRGGSKR